MRIYLTLMLILLWQGTMALPKDSVKPKVIFLDLVSSYNTFFNSRNQVRFNLGREFHHAQKGFLTISIDAGVFDKYKFIKYYDFFNSTQGYYSVNTTVLVKGIHVQPGLNYPVVQSKKYFAKGIYLGVLSDVSFYRKSKHVIDYSTLENFYAKGNQLRLNLGISSSLKYPLYHKWHLTIQTAMNRSLLNIVSSKQIETKPLNAHWVDQSNRFSWFTNVRICYEL